MSEETSLENRKRDLGSWMDTPRSIDRAASMIVSTTDQSTASIAAEELASAIDMIETLLEDKGVSKELRKRYEIFKDDLDLFFSDCMMLANYKPEIIRRSTPKR